MNTPPRGISITLAGATKAWPVREGLRRRRRTVLDEVSLHVAAGEFIGLLGASGSGKSTLIKAIAGLIDLTAGSVELDGEPMTAERLRGDNRIAYLPQDVIIHEQLTPRRALQYAARLKGLGSNGRERGALVQRALERVGLAERMDVPIHRLSGGQRKRAALASELLGDPQLILLDEATSGLDPASEADMMQLFRSLADEGRTVVCITHFPGRLALCDRLLYLMDGKGVFLGTPRELQTFFDVDSIEDVYRRQSERPAEAWREAFLSTAGGAAFSVSAPAGTDGAHAPAPAGPPVNALTQLSVQFRRYGEIQLRDAQSLLMIIAQAPAIAVMVSVVFGDIRAPYVQQHAASTREVIFVLVLAVLWCAGTLSVREIVKEQGVFRHESRLGLHVLPYAASKLVLLGAIAIVQALMLLYIVRSFTGLTGDVTMQTVVVVLLALVGVAVGLLVSAIATNSERAMTLLPVALIAQAIFSGGIAHLSGVTLRLAQTLVPAWWALDGFRTSFSSALKVATYPGPPGGSMRAILGEGGPFAGDLLALVLQGALFFAATALVLRTRRL